MAKQAIGIGTTANDGTGDPLRTAMDKTNDNFNEVYALFGNGSTLAISGDATVSAGALTIASGAVETAMIADDNVTLGKLADIKINDTTDIIYTNIAVTVVNSGGNKFYYDGGYQAITLSKGQTYRFDQSDSSNATHPLRFSTTSDGTHNSGSEYTTGVTTNGTPGSAGAYTQITTEQDTATLYTYCTAHSGMGNTVSYGASLDSRGLVSQIGLDTNDYINVQSDQINFFIDGSEDMRLQDTGTLQVEGDVVAYSTVISSDEKLKDNVETIDGALDKVKQLKGVTFNYKSNGKASGGIIAQDVEKVLPSLIKEQNTLDGSDTFKTVDYNGLVGLLIESVKELSNKLDECRNCKKIITMAIPSSGPLFLRATINLEYNGNDTDTNVSLGALSDLAGLDTPPDAMSEFYGTSAFTDPTITAQVSTSNVTHNSMRCEFSYQNNTAGANLESGFYLGTSTNMTSNTFYSEGNSTSGTRSPARVFSGLSSNTNYYIWGVVRDTESPARFTQIATSMKTQATSYDYNFNSTDYYSNYQNINSTDQYNFKTYYQHISSGSYILNQTINSTYNFANGGTNGLPMMQFSQNRYSRLLMTFTSLASGNNCSGSGYGTVINSNDSSANTPANANTTFTNFSTYGDQGCYQLRTFATHNVGGSPKTLTGFLTKGQGNAFGAQFTC